MPRRGVSLPIKGLSRARLRAQDCERALPRATARERPIVFAGASASIGGEAQGWAVPILSANQPIASISKVSPWTEGQIYRQAAASRRWSGIAVGAIAALGIAVAVALLDGFIFPASAFPAGYADMLARTSTAARLAYYIPRAVGEEVVFRGVGVSVLAWLGQYFCKRRIVVWWLAIAIVQCINLGLALPVPSGWLDFLYDGVRYFAPGLVWGWLFWRYGILAAAGAHAGAQLLIQPTLTLLYQH